MKQLTRLPEVDTDPPGTRWLLRGRKGTVQFLLWQLPPNPFRPDGVMPVDLGYHSHTPQYAGQEPMEGPCEFLDGATCYYDGSSLAADDVYRIYQQAGDAGVFARLAKYYEGVFGEPAETEDAA